MKKYMLYSEHKRAELYGDNPCDAIMRRKTLPMADHQDGEKLYGDKMIARYAPTPDAVVVRVLGIEDTSRSRRGSDKYIRVLCELTDGSIIGVDMVDVDVIITPVE